MTPTREFTILVGRWRLLTLTWSTPTEPEQTSPLPFGLQATGHLADATLAFDDRDTVLTRQRRT